MYLVGMATMCLLVKKRRTETSPLLLDALSGTAVKKPRFLSSETKHLSSESPSKPKKLLNSVEKEEQTKRGKVKLAPKVKY